MGLRPSSPSAEGNGVRECSSTLPLGSLELHTASAKQKLVVSQVLDFVTPAVELALLQAIRDSPDGWERLAKRRVQHYGYEFSYAVRRQGFGLQCFSIGPRVR